MAQTYTINCFDANNAVQSDMQAIETNFEALRTMFSGSPSPANPIAGHPWAHAGGVNGLRMRNVGNTAWLSVLLGDANTKMWMYRNDASPGWVVDTSVTDRVLSIKGGSQAYNVNGGTGAGSWTISGITIPIVQQTAVYSLVETSEGSRPLHQLTSNGLYRPAAAVGTLQYPYLT